MDCFKQIGGVLALLVSALCLSACSPTGTQPGQSSMSDGYHVGDLSLDYCNSTTAAGRDALRSVMNAVAGRYGYQVGIDYCVAVQQLQDGFEGLDVVRTWCGAVDPGVRQQLAFAFGQRVRADGLVLSETMCGVLGYDYE